MTLEKLINFRGGVKQSLSKLAIASSIVTVFGIAPAQASNLIQNGSFESPLGSGIGANNSVFRRYNAPNFGQGIPYWNLVNGSVEVFKNLGSDGNQSIDTTGLNTGNGGLGPGTLEQSFATTIGTLYTVSFDMGGGGLPSIKELEVSILDTNTPIFSQVFSLDVLATPLPSFETKNFTFIASSNISKIRFQSLIDETFNGPLLDNVSVVKSIPEPLTILGAGTAIAFGATFKRKLANIKNKNKQS